jgi:hypothetical protein
MNPTSSFNLNGYTVLLLQQNITPTSPPPSPDPTPTPTSTPPPSGSGIIFEDGFESADFRAWSAATTSSGETATTTSSLACDGTLSGRFASNGGGGFEGAYVYRSLASESELYARGYFYVSQSGIVENNDRFYLIRFQSGRNDLAYGGWRMINGQLRWSLIIRDGSNWITAYSTTSPSLNQWYSVELHWKADSSNGVGELWVNGQLVASASGENTAALGNVDTVRFGLGEVYNCGATTVYADSAVISQTRIG